MARQTGGMRAIGLFGGSFDPVHIGHLRAALDVFESLGLDELRFIPASRSPGKPPPVAPGPIRKHWLEQASRDVAGFAVDDRELRRGGESFTNETLIDIRREIPHASLYWILGADAFAGLGNWHEAETLGHLAHWVVITRPGFDLPSPLSGPSWLARALTANPRELAPGETGGVLALPVTPLAISASEIRSRIARGLRIDYLVPESIRAELLDRHVYAANTKTHPA